MYTTYFALRESPFTGAPDPRFVYVNRASQQAYATLLSGIHERKGFLLVTGEVGTGKTTLLRRVISTLEDPLRCVVVDASMLSTVTFDELLRCLCKELGLPKDEGSRLRTLQALSADLTAWAKTGGTSVLLIDEAHHLADDVLGNLRLLVPRDTGSEQLLLQIVLIGETELERKLAQPSLRQIKQRIALQCRLEGLEEREVGFFIYHRLRVAGCDRQDVFTPEAIQRITVYTEGIPCLINIICEDALRNAYRASQKTVSANLIDEVAQNLRIKVGFGGGGEDVYAAAAALRTEAGRRRALFHEQFDEVTSVFREEERRFQQLSAEASARSREADAGVVTPQPQDPEPLAVAPGPVDTARAPSWVYFLSGSTFLILLTLGLLYYRHPVPAPTPTASTLPVITLTEPAIESGQVRVHDVNRPPVITTVSPPAETLEVAVGEEQEFSVAAADPDTEDRLVFVWFLDGHEVVRGQHWALVSSAVAAASQHQVTVAVSDKEGATAERQWTVAVAKALPQPPLITRVRPTAQELAVAEGQKLRFAIAAASPQAGPVQYVWLLDGREQARGPTWTYQPQFDEGGPQPKAVTVRVTDRAHHTAERSWQVRVHDVNRPPIITAVSPPTETLEVRLPEVVSPLAVLLSKGEVQLWLEAHRQAWEEKNVDLLMEFGVVTRYQADRARQILSTYKSFSVALQDVEIRIAGSQAVVSFSRIDTIDGKAVPHPDRKHFTLEKGPNGRLTAQPQ